MLLVVICQHPSLIVHKDCPGSNVLYFDEIYGDWSNVKVQLGPCISRRIYGGDKQSANPDIRRRLGRLTAETKKQLTTGKVIDGQRQMLMTASTDQEIGALNREIKHSQISGHAITVWCTVKSGYRICRIGLRSHLGWLAYGATGTCRWLSRVCRCVVTWTD